MDKETVEQILSQIKYKDWEIEVTETLIEFFLQVIFYENGRKWTGRKWRLSEFMTKSEVVQTALKAVLTAEEHEAREKFLYRGRAIFGPHIHVDSLWAACEEKDVRV